MTNQHLGENQQLTFIELVFQIKSNSSSSVSYLIILEFSGLVGHYGPTWPLPQ